MQFFIAALLLLVGQAVMAQTWSAGVPNELVDTDVVTPYVMEGTTAGFKEALDVRDCVSPVLASFDASIGDASADARVELRTCQNPTDNEGQCFTIQVPTQEFTDYPLSTANPYVRVLVTAPPQGGDTYQVTMKCNVPAQGQLQNVRYWDVPPPVDAGSGSWYRRADCSGDSVSSVDTLNRVAFYCLSGASTAESTILKTGTCNVMTLQHLKTVVTDASEARVQSCDGDTELLATGKSFCHTIAADIDGGGVDYSLPLNGDDTSDIDGDGTSEQRAIFYAFGPLENVMLKPTVAPGVGESTRFKITCYAD